MKVKEYFRQIRKEQKEQWHLKQTIELRHMQLLPQAIRYDKDHVQTSPSDTMSESMAWIADQTRKLEAHSAKLEARRSKAIDMVSALPESDEREVMRLYYLETANGRLRTWEEVAEVMNYSIQTIFIVHGKALRNIEKNNKTLE